MDTPGSILEAARGLIGDPEAKAAFAEDPDGFLASRGLDDFSGPELAEALSHVADALPADEAAQLPDGETLASLGEAPDAHTALLGEVAAVEPGPGDGTDVEFGTGADQELQDGADDAFGDTDGDGFDTDTDGFDVSTEESTLEEELDTHIDDHLDGDLADHLHGDLGEHHAGEGFDFPS